MKDIQEETPPEDCVPLGREIERFRASTQAVIARALAGPGLVLAGLLLTAFHLLAHGALAGRWWLAAAPAALGLVLGLPGIRPFVGIVLLQLRIHENGFVLRSGDGTRAATWEAVREIRAVHGRTGAVALGVRLVHGELLEIAEDIGELRAIAARFRDAVGEKFCADGP